jgi:hypothetical protein
VLRRQSSPERISTPCQSAEINFHYRAPSAVVAPRAVPAYKRRVPLCSALARPVAREAADRENFRNAAALSQVNVDSFP